MAIIFHLNSKDLLYHHQDQDDCYHAPKRTIIRLVIEASDGRGRTNALLVFGLRAVRASSTQIDSFDGVASWLTPRSQSTRHAWMQSWVAARGNQQRFHADFSVACRPKI